MHRSKRTSRWLSLGALVAACLLAGHAHAADDTTMAEARKQFEAGVNLLDDPDGAKYEEAYHAFKKAYALSQNPKILGNLGFCAFHLERDGEAIDAYSAYLREANDIDERERAQIQKDLATLTSTAGRVRIGVKQPGTSFVLVDTRAQTRGPSVENSYAFEGHEIVVRVRPGRHTFKVKAGTMESQPVEAAVEPASDLSKEVSFAPPRVNALMTVRPSPSYAGPVILAAGGVLGLGAGVATGLLARGKESQIGRSCPGDVCPATYDLDGERDKAKTFGTVADVGFVAGGALLGGALLWYVLLPKGGSRSTTMAASAMCTGQGCGLQLQRGF